MKEFETKVNAAFPKLFSFETNVDTADDSSQYGCVVAVEIAQLGCDFEVVQDLLPLGKLSAAWLFLQKLADFTVKPAGTARAALLRHYR